MGRARVVLLGAVAAGAAVWFVGMRTGWRPVIDFQRRVNRDLLNPRMLQRVGQPGGPTAIIHHTGRRSGQPFRTPVDAVATADGFVVASVYGTDSDWVRNVLAGGPTSVETGGAYVPIADARVVPMSDVRQFFPPGDQRAHRIYDVTEAVVLLRPAAKRVTAPTAD